MGLSIKRCVALGVTLLLLASCGKQDADSKLYISVIAKGYQHQYWQVVKTGAFKAQSDFGVIVNFVAPQSEEDVEGQIELVKAELDRGPDAICIAALDTEAVLPMLAQAELKEIPVIAFDSGVPDASEGQIAAVSSTDNRTAAALAADKMYERLRGDVLAAEDSVPVYIAVLTQDYTSDSLVSRSKGFTERIMELAANDGIFSESGFIGDKLTAPLRIVTAVSASPDISEVIMQAGDVAAIHGIRGIFCTNEGAVNGLLALIDVSPVREDVALVGFDAGYKQKEAVRNGTLVGSVAQDPYAIGYAAVELAIGAAKGETVSDRDTGAVWYDSGNMDNEVISRVLYN